MLNCDPGQQLTRDIIHHISMWNFDPFTSCTPGIVTNESVKIQLRAQNLTAKVGRNSTKISLNINVRSLYKWRVQILSSAAPNALFSATRKVIIF